MLWTIRSGNLPIDPSNNVWVTSYNRSTNPVSNLLSEFTNAGTPLSPSTGFTGGGLNQRDTLVIDGSGAVWDGNYSGGTIAKFNNQGQPVAGSPFSAGGSPYIADLAIDNSGDVWTSSYLATSQQAGTFALTELANNGSLLRTVEAPGSIDYANLSIDSANDLWGTIYNTYPTPNSIFELSSVGQPLNGSPFAGNAALNQCLQTQIDGLGNLWCASDDDSSAEISGAGAAISPNAGYIAPNAVGPLQIAIDNSGNVWTAGDYGFTTTMVFYTVEMVGAAAPVITPLSLAIQMGKLGTRP